MLPARSLQDQMLRNYIESVFNRYDTDHNGTLDVQEMTKFFNDLFTTLQIGVTVTEEQSLEAIKSIDQNSDGAVSKEELFAAFKKMLNPQQSPQGQNMGNSQGYGSNTNGYNQNYGQGGYGNGGGQQYGGYNNQYGNQGYGNQQNYPNNQGYGYNQGYNSQPYGNQQYGNQGYNPNINNSMGYSPNNYGQGYQNPNMYQSQQPRYQGPPPNQYNSYNPQNNYNPYR